MTTEWDDKERRMDSHDYGYTWHNDLYHDTDDTIGSKSRLPHFDVRGATKRGMVKPWHGEPSLYCNNGIADTQGEE